MNTSTDTPTEGPWKCGNEFLPYHPAASHVSPEYRDGWNACYRAVAFKSPPEVRENARALASSPQQVVDPVGAASEMPEMPEHVLADLQSANEHMKMWAEGLANYVPTNGYDEPGKRKATITDVKKAAKFLSPRLDKASFALQDYFAAIDQIKRHAATQATTKAEKLEACNLCLSQAAEAREQRARAASEAMERAAQIAENTTYSAKHDRGNGFIPAMQRAIVANIRASIAPQAARDAQTPPSVPSDEKWKIWCETCEGSGSVHQEPQAGCHFGGDYRCPDCDGDGYWTRSAPADSQGKDAPHG